MVRIGELAIRRAADLFERLRDNRRPPRRLLDFEAEAHRQAQIYGPLNRRSLGVRTVDINLIVGSVGRSREFDASFQPMSEDSVGWARFRRVLNAMRSGEALPPIELYRLRRNYYVLDGHHRVGAARVLGIEALEAEVTLFIPSGDPQAVRLFHERRAFEQATGLQSIGGARAVTYRRLLTEVHAFRRELADQEGKPVDLVYAARLWYARVFVPAFGAVRGADLQRFYPSLRHADMLGALFAEERQARRQHPEQAHEQAGRAEALTSGENAG